MITPLHETFHQHTTPTEHQSIDELIVPFKGRWGFIRTWGFQDVVRANSNGYDNCLELYSGYEAKNDVFRPNWQLGQFHGQSIQRIPIAPTSSGEKYICY